MKMAERNNTFKLGISLILCILKIVSFQCIICEFNGGRGVDNFCILIIYYIKFA